MTNENSLMRVLRLGEVRFHQGTSDDKDKLLLQTRELSEHCGLRTLWSDERGLLLEIEKINERKKEQVRATERVSELLAQAGRMRRRIWCFPSCPFQRPPNTCRTT